MYFHSYYDFQERIKDRLGIEPSALELDLSIFSQHLTFVPHVLPEWQLTESAKVRQRQQIQLYYSHRKILLKKKYKDRMGEKNAL